MYDGFFTPSGMVPNIIQKGDRARSAETFLNNQDTWIMYMWRLINLAISVFKWDNLPDGVDERQLEFWLLKQGFVGFFKDEDLKYSSEKSAPEGYAVLPLALRGEYDMYGYPKERTAYSPYNNKHIDLTEDNSVIIFNNYLRVPMWVTIQQYAWRLARTQRIIDINIEQQRTAKVIRVPQSKRLSYLNFEKEIDEGKPWIHGDENLDFDEDIKVFDTSTPYVANEVQVYKHQIWNEALTYLGVENVNTDKKERLISDEVINNMGDVESERFTRLNARKQACNKINELFGLDIDVEFRSGVYIRTGATGASNVTTGGMEESTVTGDTYE